MLDISVESHLSLLLFSMLAGGVLGLAFEPVRFLKLSLWGRGLLRGCVRAVLTFLFDLLFMLAAGICGVLLIWSYARVFRGLTFLAMAAGFLLYRFLFGALFMKLHRFTVKLTRRVLRKLLQWLRIPLRRILSLLISLYHLTIGRFLGKIIEKIKTAREKRGELQAADEDPALPCGKEAFVYVDGKSGYRKEGRIRFGRTPE